MVEPDFREHWDRLLFRDYLIARPEVARNALFPEHQPLAQRAGHLRRDLNAARGGMAKREPIVLGDAGHGESPAVDEHLRGLVDRLVAPGRLDGRVHA
ncbi:MAG: GrpB family protein, partial [Thiobacillus sp.]|nr:GrpB family protein [Thiobacillus sp.]